MNARPAVSSSTTSLPSGTVTFLFTDIEGSTLRWERDRAAMQAALRRHDTLLRGAIESNRGTVFKTIGDAFCAVFDRPEQAVAGALGAQNALGAEDFSAADGLAVRMAIHTGTADERDGDYFGPTVNRVARLLAIGHGGQILFSGVAAGIARSGLPLDATLLDLGEHRLKDLAEPERVFQLAAPTLRAHFPALRSLSVFRHNLPQQLTSFVGRDNDVHEIKELVAEYRLVTICGAGGVGKTRSALQVAADLLDGSGDGVWFVDLAPLSSGEFVISEIASVFGVQQQTGEHRTVDAVVDYLKSRRLLLILDNCEHVMTDVRNVTSSILRGCPDVRFLTTTREALNISGERVYRLPSLPLPSEGTVVTAQESLAYGAVALFVDRAIAADSRFVLSDESAPIAVEICRRLDGIPLALELAAARLKALGIRNLAARLDERLRILTGGNRAALPRQQTMRALIDWSHDLLSDAERAVFRRAAIFSGGWTLEAAEAICADDVLDPLDVLDLHSSLIDKSLLVAEQSDNDTRFRLLESTRAYARERLQLAGEGEEIARKHAQRFLEFSKRMRDESQMGNSGRPWLMQIKLELANLRGALEWAIGASGDPRIAAGIIEGGLCGFWWFTTKNEGRRWIERALERVDPERYPDAATTLYRVLGSFADAKRSVEAQRAAIAILERTGSSDFRRIGAILEQLATALIDLDRLDEAHDAISRSLQAYHRGNLEVTHLYASALATEAHLLRSMGRLDEARTLVIEARDLFVRLGDTLATSAQQTNLAEIDFALGDILSAKALAQSSAETARTLGALNHAEDALLTAAACHFVLGELDDARALAREALDVSRQREDLDERALLVFSAIAAARNDLQRCARLLGFVESILEQRPYRRAPSQQTLYETVQRTLHEQVERGELLALLSLGAQLSEKHVAAEALQI